MKSARSSRPVLEQLESRELLTGGFQPTAAEQLLIYQLNQIRANPAAYGTSIGLNLSNVSPSQPLAVDPLVTEAARLHAQDMNSQGYFSQTSLQGADPGQRLTQAGVPWVGWGESSAAGSSFTTTSSALQSLIVDSGSATLADRTLLLALNAQYQTQAIVGVGIVQNGSGPLANYYTIDTASLGNSAPFVTGVAFVDNPGTGQYAVGEGLGSVTITITGEGLTYTTATFGSGGYSQQLPAGTYKVTASGGGLVQPVSKTVTLTTSNVEVDFALSPSQVQPAQEAWVGLIYRDLLGRVPQPSEIANWVGDLQNGATQADVVNGFLYSAEYAQDLVTGWFQQYLHRTPDSGGLTAFSTALENGATEDSVRAAILGSTEFYVLSGNTATGFVNALYQDILGRTPGGNEAAGWIQLVTKGQAMTVVNGLINSGEARSLQVTQDYQTLLRRNPDGGGLSTFANMLIAGAGERTIVRDLATSPEYFNDAGNVLWLQSIYESVLGRNGDSVAQLGSWLAALHSGESLVAVATGFTSSAEASADVVSSLYHQLLNRAPDSAGLNYFVSVLQNTGHSAAVIEGIASSAEFYALQGGTNTSWIQGLYHDLLGRYASTTEVNVWLNQLQLGQSQAQVIANFLGTTEYQTDYITNYFNLYLQRSPTPFELGQYLSQLQSGTSDAALLGGLLASQAYYSHVTG
jgi:hypothetical protein